MFENTVVPRDFDEIVVPFPERGEPELVKGELEPASSGEIREAISKRDSPRAGEAGRGQGFRRAPC